MPMLELLNTEQQTDKQGETSQQSWLPISIWHIVLHEIRPLMLISWKGVWERNVLLSQQLSLKYLAEDV